MSYSIKGSNRLSCSIVRITLLSALKFSDIHQSLSSISKSSLKSLSLDFLSEFMRWDRPTLVTVHFKSEFQLEDLKRLLLASESSKLSFTLLLPISEFLIIQECSSHFLAVYRSEVSTMSIFLIRLCASSGISFHNLSLKV